MGIKTGTDAPRRSGMLTYFLDTRLAFRAQNFLSSTLLVWLAIVIYRYTPYYSGFLIPRTQTALLLLALAYTIGGLVYYILVPNDSLKPGKGLIVVTASERFAKDTWGYIQNFARPAAYPTPKLQKIEKIAILFIIVKLFFLPLMINFLFGNYDAVKAGIDNASSINWLFSVNTFNAVLFPLFFSMFLLIDTAFFTFGYAVEARFLGNSVRSVDPTVLGWVVVLICYPPFNSLGGIFAPWYANDYVLFSTPKTTFIMHLIALLFMGIYASASVALGAKASNLTNRGIVDYGPYSLVRHPAYISKNIAWWITIIPVFGLAPLLSMATWSFIYFMRSITEERHLLRDPDYQAYCRKVRYRFIPGVW